jgi:hypothetical protein
VGDDDGPAGGDLAALAGAVEQTLAPPYRATGVRRGEGIWAVGARRMEVVELGDDVEGEAIELAMGEAGPSTVVDGAHTIRRFPELEALAAGRHDSYVVTAARLTESLWEVEVAPL